MTDPNQATRADILAARERVKAKVHPAHACDIDAGLWDAFGMVQGELQEMIRERAGEEAGE